LVEILSQDEIEALLSSLSSEASGPGEASDPATRSRLTAPAPADPRQAAKREARLGAAYEVYDFRRPDKLSKDQLRTLQMVHETCSRLLASSLSAYLRVSTQVDLVSVEQIPYEEYMRSLTSSIVNVVTLPPLAGQAILEIDFGIALAMIDRLLGGPGNMTKPTAVLTEIEKALTESIVARALKELKTAWEGVVHFNPRRELMETQPQFVQIVPPNDIVVSVLFEVKVGEFRGAMSLCIPYLTLKPVTDRLCGHRWTSPKDASGQSARALARQLAGAAVEATCRLGGTRISVGQLMSLKVGDTIALDRRADDEVDVLVGGILKFRGRPGRSSRKLAVHINRPVVEDAPGSIPMTVRGSVGTPQ